MHLSNEPFTIRFVAGITLLWVALICIGLVADVGTR
jgi:hypothetical protein